MHEMAEPFSTVSENNQRFGFYVGSFVKPFYIFTSSAKSALVFLTKAIIKGSGSTCHKLFGLVGSIEPFNSNSTSFYPC